MQYEISFTEEYEEWFQGQSKKFRYQIVKRLENIKKHGYFGHIREIDDDILWELKWKIGRRIYYTKEESYVLLLCGGNKNGQEKDINRARNILKREEAEDQ